MFPAHPARHCIRPAVRARADLLLLSCKENLRKNAGPVAARVYWRHCQRCSSASRKDAPCVERLMKSYTFQGTSKNDLSVLAAHPVRSQISCNCAALCCLFQYLCFIAEPFLSPVLASLEGRWHVCHPKMGLQPQHACAQRDSTSDDFMVHTFLADTW